MRDKRTWYPGKDDFCYLLSEHGFNDHEILELNVMLKWTYPDRECYYNVIKKFMMDKRGCIDKDLIEKILDLTIPSKEKTCDEKQE